jgi:LemA protein
VARDEKVTAAMAQVENVIERRFELIPKLTALVHEYSDFEKGVITSLAAARESFATAAAFTDKAKALENLNAAITGYERAAARIPELKSSRLYENLMFEIAGSDNRISVERKRYNEAVSEYNSYVRRQPLADYIEALGFAKNKPYLEYDPKK